MQYREEGPEIYTFSDKVRAGIYDDLSIDFSEFEFDDLAKKTEKKNE